MERTISFTVIQDSSRIPVVLFDPKRSLSYLHYSLYDSFLLPAFGDFYSVQRQYLIPGQSLVSQGIRDGDTIHFKTESYDNYLKDKQRTTVTSRSSLKNASYKDKSFEAELRDASSGTFLLFFLIPCFFYSAPVCCVVKMRIIEKESNLKTKQQLFSININMKKMTI
jgi:hypothetical protein